MEIMKMRAVRTARPGRPHTGLITPKYSRSTV